MLPVLLLIVAVGAASPQCSSPSSLNVSVSCTNDDYRGNPIQVQIKGDTSLGDALSLAADLCRNSSSSTHQEGQSDYVSLPGQSNVYKHHKDVITWEQGRAICEKEGAHMVVLNSQEEADAVYDLADCCPWVGVNRDNSSAPWMTAEGNALNSSGYTGWVTNYPVRSGNCVMLFDNGEKGMINWICSYNEGVVCERNSS